MTVANLETLTCARCGSDFDRERKRGVKPKHCPDCMAEALAEAAAAAAAEQHTQTLHCEACGKDWERPAQRGKPPKRCADCAAPKAPVARPAPVSQPAVAAPAPAVAQTVTLGNGHRTHYSVERLLKDNEGVPMEEQYKFLYIESQLKEANVPVDRAAALKRVWTALEGDLK